MPDSSEAYLCVCSNLEMWLFCINNLSVSTPRIEFFAEW